MLLGLPFIAVTAWESSASAAAALREATYQRLTAIASTKGRQIERYFRDLRNHTLALSSDESTVTALEEFRTSWNSIPKLAGSGETLRTLYREFPSDWYPADLRTRSLQNVFVAANPYPEGMRQQLLSGSGLGMYSDTHASFHPTLQRYQSAFGFYDTFLIDARDGRILYTVRKELDLGMRLTDDPYRRTSLGRIFRRTVQLNEPESSVIEDYQPYPPSRGIPAAFLAAPIWRRGARIGVLAIQVSIEELDRVMNNDRNWREEGLGATGQAYIVGPDDKLRSDARFGVGQTPTAVLNVTIPSDLARTIRDEGPATQIGSGLSGTRVLRSHTPLNISGLQWMLIAEIETNEAFAPIRALQIKMLAWGLAIAAVFLVVARALARSVTEPVLALSRSAARIGRRDFEARIPVRSGDEIGQMAASFNQMAEDLRRTTVSKEELEALAGRLITAQEDERARIARELHDDITQRLAAAAIGLGKLQRSVPVHEDEVARLKGEIVQLSNDVHGLSRRLHPSSLDDVGLIAAVESECRNFFERGGPPVSFSAEGELDAMSRDVQLALYRIVQEGLRNVQQHSHAEDVSVCLRRNEDTAELEIQDNGRGFEPNDRLWRRGVGLASMEERASLLGGRCTIESKRGKGTRIHVRLPLSSAYEKTESAVGRRSQDRP